MEDAAKSVLNRANSLEGKTMKSLLGIRFVPS